MHIRSATLNDASTLFNLVLQFPTPTPPDEVAFGRSLSQKLYDPMSRVAVAADGTELCGYISGTRHATFYANGNTAWVDEILVVESSRGNGTGRLLLADFEDWALSGGCVLVGLATAGAKSFYERLGYASKAGYFKKYLVRGV